MRTYKREIEIPNKKAPRMRKGKFSTQVVTRDLFKRFKVAFPQYEAMTWAEFFSSWEDIAQTIRVEAATNPLGVKLHAYIGELKTQYLPYRFPVMDIPASFAEGYRIHRLTVATNGKTPRVKWERRWAVTKNVMLQFYAFEPCRELLSLASDYVDKHPEKIRVSRNTLGGKRTWR